MYNLKTKQNLETANPPLLVAAAAGTWNSDPTLVDNGLDVFFVDDKISRFEHTKNQENGTENQEENTDIRQELQLSPTLAARLLASTSH
jgi:hypothetical protein